MPRRRLLFASRHQPSGFGTSELRNAERELFLFRRRLAIAGALIINFGYPITMETLTRGRTVGAFALGLRAVRDELPGVSHQAVYDSLHALTGAGLVRRIQPAGSVARYEARTGDNHHHVVCRSCGSVADVDCAVGAAPCLTPSEDHGFVIDEAEVVFPGLCADCQVGAGRTGTPAPTATRGATAWPTSHRRARPPARPTGRC